MTEKLLSIIQPIKDLTGMEISVYSPLGQKLATTDSDTERKRMQLPDLEEGEVFQDAVRDLTVFDLKIQSKHYVGVIEGSNGVSRNYAVLVSKLLEADLSGYGKTLDRSDEFRMLLEGELNRAQIEQFKLKYPAVKEYYVLVFLCGKKSAMLEYLRDVCQSTDFCISTSGKGVTVLKDVKNLEEYQSASDFAHMVCENVEQELGIKPEVGVGDSTHAAEEIPLSFRQALDALRLGKLLDPNAQVYNHKDYFLVNLFEELPRDRIARMLDACVDATAAEIFDDREMMETAEQFLLGSLNISETARVMFMHRNTLIYRLDKIEKATGLNIRRFADAMTFRTLSMLYKLNRKVD